MSGYCVVECMRERSSERSIPPSEIPSGAAEAPTQAFNKLQHVLTIARSTVLTLSRWVRLRSQPVVYASIFYSICSRPTQALRRIGKMRARVSTGADNSPLPPHGRDAVQDMSDTGPHAVLDASGTREESAGGGNGQPSGNRVTVYEAAEILGVTVDAIRKRIQRGTIPHERHEDGRVYVLLDAASKVQDRPQASSGNTTGTVQDVSGIPTGGVQDTSREELVESLKDQVEYLRQIIERRDMELQRKDTIIAQLTQRIPELPPTASQESPQASGTVAGGAGSSDDVPPDVQEPSDRRSWLYRFFFGP